MLNIMPTGTNILDVDLENPANCIFIPVNTVGVMGKGLALQFKRKYLNYFCLYKAYCDSNDLLLGKPITTPFVMGKGSVVFFPTKDDWRNKSELVYIREGLIRMAVEPNWSGWRWWIKHIHIPKLGCGLGSLDWADVRPIIEQFAECMPEHEVYLYE